MPSQRLFPILYNFNVRDQMRDLRLNGVMQIVIGLPWAMIAPHEKQAMKNHSQSLERLADRGGLGAGEAVLVLTGKPLTFHRDTPADYLVLNKLLDDWLAGIGKNVKTSPSAAGAA